MHDGSGKIRFISTRAYSLTYVRAGIGSILPYIRAETFDVSIPHQPNLPPPPSPSSPTLSDVFHSTALAPSPDAVHVLTINTVLKERRRFCPLSLPLVLCFLSGVTRFNCCPFARVVKYSFTGPNGAWRAVAQYKGPANLERSSARPIHHHTAGKHIHKLLIGGTVKACSITLLPPNVSPYIHAYCTHTVYTQYTHTHRS